MNNRLIFFFVILTGIVVFSINAVNACTTFVIHQENHLLFGRNLDWPTGTGLVMFNQRNLEKVALVDASEKPAKWISKFGSITFNQVGRDLPYGGMNENGLVVEQMTLDQTVYPSRDNRSGIGACQWIQYQLDNCSTIEEVIQSDTVLRIVDGISKLHFLVCDRSGHTASIEFLNGKMVCHTESDLPVQVLANSPYAESIKCYNDNGDTKSNRSLFNFVTAAHQVKNPDVPNDTSSIAYAFRVLRSVSQGLATKWSIVYDITNMKIHFKIFETPTIVGEQKIFTRQPPYDPVTKIVDFKGLDFDCSARMKVLDINCDIEGRVNQSLTDYSTDINKEFIVKAFSFFKNWGIPIDLKEPELTYLAQYPESFRCVMK
jgi:hypothetical protein